MNINDKLFMCFMEKDSLAQYAGSLGIGIETLVHGLSRHIARAAGKPVSVVVKVSGQNLEKNEAYDLEVVCGSLVFMQGLLQQVNSGLLVVHGAGPQLDKAIEAAGLPNKKVNGLRYTDDAIYQAVEKEVQHLNQDVVNMLRAYGANATPMPKTVITATSLGPRNGGRVGKPVAINYAALANGLKAGNCQGMPIVMSLGVDGNLTGYNINADDVSAMLVSALKPELFLNITTTGGILANTTDKKSIMPHLTMEEALGLSKDGMAVKVEAIKTALEASPRTKVVITSPADMACSLFKTAGTVLTYK